MTWAAVLGVGGLRTSADTFPGVRPRKTSPATTPVAQTVTRPTPVLSVRVIRSPGPDATRAEEAKKPTRLQQAWRGTDGPGPFSGLHERTRVVRDGIARTKVVPRFPVVLSAILTRGLTTAVTASLRLGILQAPGCPWDVSPRVRCVLPSGFPWFSPVRLWTRGVFFLVWLSVVSALGSLFCRPLV